MAKLARSTIRYSKLILIVTAALILFSLFSVRDLRFEDDFTEYVPEGDPEVSFFNSLEDVFEGFQRKSMLVALEFDNLFTPENLATVEEMVQVVETLSEVKSVNALTNMPRVLTTEFGIEVREVMDVLPSTAEEALWLRKDVEGDDQIWGRLVTEDGQGTILSVAFYYEVDEYEAIDRVIEATEPLQGNAEITYFGMPIVQRESARDAQSTMVTLTPLAALALLLILYWGFRSLRGVLLPIFIAVFASIVTIGISAAIGKPLSIISAALPIMLLALVTAYGIHFINRYHEECGHGSCDEAAERTLRVMFFPITLSALTTMGGFMSLLTAEIRPVSDFGLFSTLGIFFGLVFATFSLGAYYHVFTPKAPPRQYLKGQEGKRDALHRMLQAIAFAVTNRKKLVLSVMVALLVFLGLGIPFIEVEMSVEDMMGADHPIIQLLDYFEERFGGTDSTYVYLEADSVRDPYTLREMVRLAHYGDRYHAFGDGSSVADLIMDLNEAFEGWRAVPATRDKVDNLWFFVEDNNYFQGRISDDERSTLVEYRAKEIDSQTLSSEISDFNAFLSERPASVVSAAVTEEGAAEYLAHTVVDDLVIFGVNPFDREAVQKLVLDYIETPLDEFFSPDQAFAQEVAHYMVLEIEDLGFTPEEVAGVLAGWYMNRDEELEVIIEEELGLDEMDAWYLADLLFFAEEQVSASRKVESVRAAVSEKIGGMVFDDSFDFVFYQVLDEVVYMPAQGSDLSLAYRITGGPVINNYITGKLFNQQSRSTALAFLIVFGLLLLQLRSGKKAVIAMIPIALTVFASFGLMGHFGVPLNIATLMVASIAIGAGIDYTIHFLYRWYNEQGQDPAGAIYTTITRTGRGIFLNSVAVAGGIYVLATSNISMLRIFGSLVATVLLSSVVFTMFLLPLILQAEEKVFRNISTKGGK